MNPNDSTYKLTCRVKGRGGVVQKASQIVREIVDLELDLELCSF